MSDTDTGGIKSTSDTCILGVIFCGSTTPSCRRSNHEGHGHGYQRPPCWKGERRLPSSDINSTQDAHLIRHGWFNGGPLATGLAAAASWGFADPPTSLAARGIVRRLQRYVAATSQPFFVHHIHRLQSPGRYEATPCISPCPSRDQATLSSLPPPERSFSCCSRARPIPSSELSLPRPLLQHRFQILVTPLAAAFFLSFHLLVVALE